MRTPPDIRSKCRICGKLLGYEIGSVAWQCRDDDLCGYDKCYNEPIKDVADRIRRDFQQTGGAKPADLNRVFGNPKQGTLITRIACPESNIKAKP